jgi:hypothetical protein
LRVNPGTLGLKVPSRRPSTHVHGRPHTSTGDHPIAVPRFQGRPPAWLSIGCQQDRPGRASTRIETASSEGRPGLGRGFWPRGSGRGRPPPFADYDSELVHTRLGGSPEGRPIEPRPFPAASVVGLPRIGGLHHRYVWAKAAWGALAPTPRRRRIGG